MKMSCHPRGILGLTFVAVVAGLLSVASAEDAALEFKVAELRGEQVASSELMDVPHGDRQRQVLELVPNKTRLGYLLALTIPELAGGRYELEVPLAGRDHPQTILDPTRSLFIEVQSPAGLRKRYPVIAGIPDADGWHMVRTPLDVAEAKAAVTVWLGWETHGPVDSEPGAARIGDISLKLKGRDAFIANVRMEKIHYRPGAMAKVTADLFNPAEELWEGELVLRHESDVTVAKEIARIPVRMEPGEATAKSAEFTVGTAQFGHVVRATMEQNGRVQHTAADVFSVAENFWDVALGTIVNGFVANTGMYGDRAPELIKGKLAFMRDHYSNWYEMTFWAPDDWGNLTPEEDEWMSGQAARWSNAKWIKEMNRMAKPEGIKAITYGKGLAGGPSAWELLREKPHFFHRSANGMWGTHADLWEFDHWNDPQFHLKEWSKYTSVWHRLIPDLSQMDALDFGIDELIHSTREFGWDGVRFDGQFTAVDDVVSTRNMQHMKKRIWSEYPDYLFGFNMCSIFDRGDRVPHEEREAMAGGGHWMQEAINHFIYEGDKRYETWRHYAENEWEAARRVRELEGTYHYIYRLGGPDPLRFYKFAIGALNGAHPTYGGHENAPGSRNWGRFLTQWGALWWHPHLAAFDPDASGIKTEGLTEQVVWDFWARRIPVSADHEILAIPFLNLPDTLIEETNAYPPAITGARIQVPVELRKRVEKAIWLDPSAEDENLLKISDAGWIALPEIARMGILALVLKGSPDFRDIQRERFTEPVDPEQLAASLASGKKMIVVDPLRPELNKVEDDPHPAVVKVHAAGVSWSMKRAVVDDPKAETGRAAGGDSELPGFTTGGYFYEILPGKYRVTARVRKTPAGTPFRFTGRIYENVKDGKGYLVRPESLTVKNFDLPNRDGEYQEVLLTEDYQHHGLGFGTVFIAGTVDPKMEKDPKLLLDWVQFERLETYTDRTLAELSGLPLEVTLPVGERDRVLWVRGMDDLLYNLEPALEVAFGEAHVDKVYQREFSPTAESLANYGTIILPNVPASALVLTGRKLIRDWVLSGGHLVILGGNFTLGQGGMKDSFFEDVLPVTLAVADVVPLKPAPSIVATGGDKAGGGQVFYAHELKPKEAADVLFVADGSPIAVRGAAGKGFCTVFGGTVLGAKASEPSAFWNQPGWKEHLAGLISTKHKN